MLHVHLALQHPISDPRVLQSQLLASACTAHRERSLIIIKFNIPIKERLGTEEILNCGLYNSYGPLQDGFV